MSEAHPRLTPDFAAELRATAHDPLDPDPWLALFLDQTIPIDDQAKAAVLLDGRSRSRQFLMPTLRPFARLGIIVIQILKLFLPRVLTSTRLLHQTIYWGLKYFVSPEANFLILRHMHIGTEVMAFIRDNTGCAAPTVPLRPNTVEALKDNVFLQHDLNLFNFVIGLNTELRAQGLPMPMARAETLNFQAITDGPFPLQPLPGRWSNFVDLSTAIEIYTPMYQLLLSDADFWRASNSLQLDETIALYIASLLQDGTHLALINNKHPMIPLSTMRAANRLVLHGLAAESLHGLLVRHKRAAAAGIPGTGLPALWKLMKLQLRTPGG